MDPLIYRICGSSPNAFTAVDRAEEFCRVEHNVSCHADLTLDSLPL